MEELQMEEMGIQTSLLNSKSIFTREETEKYLIVQTRP